ncbi:MAG: hypothetical protein AB2704_24665, partial [Candidatus Thiodiazotropha taylori]
ALKSNNDNEVLPHGKAMRLQVGGLRGLFSVLYPDQTTPEVIEDVFQLISRAKAEFNSLDNLPFQTLIQHVSAYQGRRRLR